MSDRQNNITIIDESGPFLELLARTLPAEFNRAIRSLGYWLRGEIKTEFSRGSAGRLRLARRSPVHARQTKDGTILQKTGNLNRNLPGGRRLPNLVRYRHDPADMAVHVGWLNDRIARLAWSFQAGGEQKVTRAQRRLYSKAGRARMSAYTARGAVRQRGPKRIAGSGVTMAVGDKITVPERQVIGPMYDLSKREIPIRIEQRIQHYLRQANARAGRRIITQATASLARAL